jgi:predicted nuclease of predicted toxin-antitoxin system
MKFLIDENLSPRVAVLLRDGGVDATHILEYGLGGVSDNRVSALVVAEDRAVISADSDFSTLLSLSGDNAPSLVLLRSTDQLKPPAQAALLLANLPTIEADLTKGAVVSLSATHLRVRFLPLDRTGSAIQPPGLATGRGRSAR